MMYGTNGWMNGMNGGWGNFWILACAVFGILVIALLTAILIVLINKKHKE